MPAQDVLQVSYVQACNDVRFSNVINFLQTSSDVGNPMSDLSQWIRETLAVAYANALSTSWSDRCVHIRKLYVAGLPLFRQATAATPGEVIDEALATENCAQLNLQPESLGRGKVGRLFISGIPVGGEEDNCLTHTERDLLQAIADLLTENIVGAAGNTFRAGLAPAQGTFYAFTRGFVNTAITLQKSRKQPFPC